ncbi:MAG TPA: DMT family transporter [Thermomicrobiales bacterium]|jgi:drug/metabolite transporter (DMT)-like permease|nr:DMT family transporter [Thermomicrobiales bacterium]
MTTAASSSASAPGFNQTSVLVQFILLALVWGSSFLFMRVAADGVSAPQIVLARVGFGAVALWVILAVTRQRFPASRAAWGHLAVAGVVFCVVPFLLFAWAAGQIASSLSSIYNATTPLMTTLVALAALPSERLTGPRLAGLFAGFLGVIIVLGPWQGLGGSSLLAQLACLAASACYGVALVYIRRFVAPLKLGAIPVAATQVTIAAAIMLVLAPAIAIEPVDLDWSIVASLLALGVLGTGVAYVWSTNTNFAWGATNASTVTYLIPLVGVTLGVLVLGEHITWNEPVGALVVVIGILLTQGRLDRWLPSGRMRPAKELSR